MKKIIYTSLVLMLSSVVVDDAASMEDNQFNVLSSGKLNLVNRLPGSPTQDLPDLFDLGAFSETTETFDQINGGGVFGGGNPGSLPYHSAEELPDPIVIGELSGESIPPKRQHLSEFPPSVQAVCAAVAVADEARVKERTRKKASRDWTIEQKAEWLKSIAPSTLTTIGRVKNAFWAKLRQIAPSVYKNLRDLIGEENPDIPRWIRDYYSYYETLSAILVKHTAVLPWLHLMSDSVRDVVIDSIVKYEEQSNEKKGQRLPLIISITEPVNENDARYIGKVQGIVQNDGVVGKIVPNPKGARKQRVRTIEYDMLMAERAQQFRELGDWKWHIFNYAFDHQKVQGRLKLVPSVKAKCEAMLAANPSAFDWWKKLRSEYGHDLLILHPGVLPHLAQLGDDGFRMAIVKQIRAFEGKTGEEKQRGFKIDAIERNSANAEYIKGIEAVVNEDYRKFFEEKNSENASLSVDGEEENIDDRETGQPDHTMPVDEQPDLDAESLPHIDGDVLYLYPEAASYALETGASDQMHSASSADETMVAKLRAENSTLLAEKMAMQSEIVRLRQQLSEANENFRQAQTEIMRLNQQLKNVH